MGGGLWEVCVVVVIVGGVGMLLGTHGAPPTVDYCKPTNCWNGGPEIRFPFLRKGDPCHCGYPGFQLSCQGNATMVELHSARQSLPVTSISYVEQRLHLDPRSCPLAVFLNLNLSDTPFNNQVRGTYILVNCTSEAPATFPYRYRDGDYYDFIALYGYVQLKCLDGHGHRVFAVPRGDILNQTCISMRTELFDKEFASGLCSKQGAYDPSLSWQTPDCKSCKDGSCGFIKGAGSRQVDCSKQGAYDPSLFWGNGNPSVDWVCAPTPTSGHWKASIIIGVSIGVFVFIFASATLVKFYLSWKKKKEKEIQNQIQIEKFLEAYKALNPMRYTYADIKKFTDHFKTKLGEGGYGSVYKGLLPSGIEVAVKMLKRTVGNIGEEFVNEVQTIGRIHHVNVVRLLGFCADGNKRALIYEYMPNDSLEKFLLVKDCKISALGWSKLHEIAVGIARGIEYLHQGCDQRILHFDIKPRNILLDHNMTPKISDFGLAKLCSKEKSIVSMSVARGTVGYIAPEVASKNVGNVSSKSDIYSFGMLLLEMIRGGKNGINSSVESPSQTYFSDWIYNHIRRDIEYGVSITEQPDANLMRVLAITALWCIQWYPVNRPSITKVVQMLEGKADDLVIPPNPFVTKPSVQEDSTLRVHCEHLDVISEAE